MGAGCYYTHENGEKAYWLEPDMDEQEDGPDEPDWHSVHDEICTIMIQLGYEQKYANNQKSKLDFENGLAIVEFEYTYSREGLIIKIKERDDAPNMMNLFNANFHKIEKRIAKAMNKLYTIAFATTGYTAHRIKPGEFK